MKVVIRSVILVLIMVAFLWASYNWGLVDFSLLLSVFANNHWILLALALIQIIMTFLGSVRYWLILQRVGIAVRLRDVFSATFLSTGVGLWLPGSSAAIEALRVGIMTGYGTRADRMSQPVIRITSLVFGGLFDRILGLVAIHAAGFLSIVISWKDYSTPAVTLLGVYCLLVVLFFPALVLLLQSRWWHRFNRLAVTILAILRHLPGGPTLCDQFFVPVGRKVLMVLAELKHPLFDFSKVKFFRWGQMSSAFVISLVIAGFSAMSLQLAALAFQAHLDFWGLLAGTPLVAVAGFLPLGFAGLGGYQLAAAGIFSLFFMDMTQVASASVLVNVVSLVVSTLVGLGFLFHFFDTVRAFLCNRKRAISSASPVG